MLVGLGNMDDTLPISGVKGSVLEKVVEWCTRHQSAARQPTYNNWDRRFWRVDQKMLSGIIQAAIFLDIKDLYNVAICDKD